MSIKNILLLTVLMNFGLIHNSIQAEFMDEMDIPRLNVSRIVGKWYLLVAPAWNDDISCISSIIEQQSAENFTIRTNYTLTPDAIKNNPTMPKTLTLFPMQCMMQKESNVIISWIDTNVEMYISVFDVDYDSYMAVYTENIIEMTRGMVGQIFIVSRQQILADGVIDKVKQSSFYQRVIGPDSELMIFNPTDC